jgi:hypothetical protein
MDASLWEPPSPTANAVRHIHHTLSPAELIVSLTQDLPQAPTSPPLPPMVHGEGRHNAADSTEDVLVNREEYNLFQQMILLVQRAQARGEQLATVPPAAPFPPSVNSGEDRNRDRAEGTEEDWWAAASVVAAITNATTTTTKTTTTSTTAITTTTTTTITAKIDNNDHSYGSDKTDDYPTNETWAVNDTHDERDALIPFTLSIRSSSGYVTSTEHHRTLYTSPVQHQPRSITQH